MRWLCPILCLGLLGCLDLDDFRSGDDVYRGEVIGGGSDVFRQGFAADTWLDLDFDPALADGVGPDAAPPGRIDTWICVDGHGVCAERVPGPIVDAPLERFPALDNDALGGYDFPGPARVRNYIMAAPRSDAAGQRAMVFVSLMEAGGVEVRVIAPDSGEDAPGLFGVFPLQRVQP